MQKKTMEQNQLSLAVFQMNQDIKQTTEEVSQALRGLIKSGFYGRMSLSLRCAVRDALTFFQCTEQILQNALCSEVDRAALEALLEHFQTARKLQKTLQEAWKENVHPTHYSEERFLVIAHLYRECDTLFYSLEKLEVLIAQKSLIKF